MFKEEKAIVGTHIEKIEKFDELVNHHLNTFLSHCIRKVGVLKPNELRAAMAAESTEQLQEEKEKEKAAKQMAEEKPLVQQDPRKAILEAMKEIRKQEKFINKDALFLTFKGKLDKLRFEQELDNLMNDGEICTAFDSDHYCLTED